ncbi:MAG: hypothetical protein K2W96_05655 [Gemmataceae bacterium]|nr:hypothetical protein [Gemmataceae bacterium]
MMGFFVRLGQLVAEAATAFGSGIASAFAAFGRGWDRFWFAPGDPYALGVLRLGAGGVLLWMLVATTPLLPALYGPDAWVDHRTANLIRKEQPYIPPVATWKPQEMQTERDQPVYRPWVGRPQDSRDYTERWKWWRGYVFSQGNAQFSPFFHLKTLAGMYVFHAASLLVAVLFLLGVGTRVTSVLAWIVALCYIHRVQAALFGMDTILVIVLLYLAIGPSGACLSVDNRMGWARDEASAGANLALRLMQVHFCFIYLASGTSKLQGAAWWNGTALWQTLSNYEFTPRIELYTEFLRWLTHDRALWEAFHWIGGSLFTLGLEIGLPFLVWRKDWRWLCVIGACLLHSGIGLTMGLTSFSVLMMLLVGSFIPGKEFRKALGAKPMRRIDSEARAG